MATDIRNFGAVADGVTDCSAAINSAVIAGDILIYNGTFLLTQSIKIPSNRTVYIANAKLKMADNSLDNIFRNSDFTNGNSNINIIGQGAALLDGNAANNSDEYATYGIEGTYGYKYVGLMFCNVDTFEISGVNILNQAHYSIALQKATNGVLHDIYLNQYAAVTNQDGISIIYGCHDLELYNIKGHSRDDFFNFHIGKGNSNLQVRDISNPYIGDVHDIDIHDIEVFSAQQGGLYAAIVGDGNKEYNISFSDIICHSVGSLFYASYGSGYYDSPPAKTDWYNITMDTILLTENIRAGVFNFGENMKDITITNLTDNSGKTLVVNTGGDQDNVHINGVEIYA